MSRSNVSAIILSVFFASWAQETVKLKLDYASAENWQYGITYQSECIFDKAGSSSSKNTNISCGIVGKVEEKKRINLHVENLVLNSEFYTQDVKAQVAEKLAKTVFSVGIKNGYPAIDNEIDLSPNGLPEWNLYVQLAKLMPEVPEKAVKKGFTWERHASMPIRSSQGTAQCEVYRQFKVEKISKSKDTAYISWQFSYTASDPTVDTSTILKYVPVAGTGQGTAVLNVTKGYLVRAEMEFVTPVVTLDNVAVNWKEKAVLEFKEPINTEQK